MYFSLKSSVGLSRKLFIHCILSRWLSLTQKIFVNFVFLISWTAGINFYGGHASILISIRNTCARIEIRVDKRICDNHTKLDQNL